jgi:phosphoribosylcarboxyaminoimidazole (NCAIR) mutase
LFAVAMLSITQPSLRERLHAWRHQQTQSVADDPA